MTERRVFAPLGLCLAACATVWAADPRPMTLDWIFSDEGEAIAKAPDADWTADGDVRVLDARRPKAERTLERYRTASGTPTRVDAPAALASLGALLGGTGGPDSLEWPASFDGAGRAAAYAYGGDVYRL